MHRVTRYWAGGAICLLLICGAQAAPPEFSITTLGLTDTEHTRDTDGYRSSIAKFLNEAGQVAGQSFRYGIGGTNLGSTAWLYDGANTLNIGLIGAEHTSSTTGSRSSSVRTLNEAGQVAGTSTRFGFAGFNAGTSAWLYDGAQTLNIGLTDAGHTSDFEGYRSSFSTIANQAGQVLGYSQRYGAEISEDLGRTAWLYDGTSTVNIGLTSPEYTRATDGYRYSQSTTTLNEAGQAAGFAYRQDRPEKTAWLYDGTSTFNIGLTDVEHTRDTDGYRSGNARIINESGQVTGFSDRFGSGGAWLGWTAWLYDGTRTLNIGMTDVVHTRSTDGYRESTDQALNEAGHVQGYSDRFGVGGTNLGQTVWFYDGVSTQNIGPTDAEHTRDTDGYRHSISQRMNEASQSAGQAERYGGGGTDLGHTIWLYDGTSTLNIGLIDSEHTRDTDGYRASGGNLQLNEAGHAAGIAARFGTGGTDLGWTAWLYDGETTHAIDRLSERPNGYSFSVVEFLAEDDTVLGYYELFRGNTSLGNRAFWYTFEDGAFDLGLLVDEGFDDWAHLANVISMSANGLYIVGEGLLTDITEGEMAYLLTATVVPVPAAVWLFGSALGVLGWIRRKSA